MPNSYWSSKLRSYEKNYSISEKEALACISGMLHFKKYLLGRKFTLKTEHCALIALMGRSSTKVSSARTERWREKVSVIDYTVEYLRGEDNTIADWLSRYSVEVKHSETPFKEQYLINEVKTRLHSHDLEYGEEMKEILQIFRNNGAWSEDKKKKFPDFFRIRAGIIEKD